MSQRSYKFQSDLRNSNDRFAPLQMTAYGRDLPIAPMSAFCVKSMATFAKS